MRTKVTIDDDVLSAARRLAERDGKTIGEAISALARAGLSRAHPPTASKRNGIPLLGSRAGAAAVTLELVNQLRDKLP